MAVRGFDKECYFGKKKTRKCCQCKKTITPATAILGYNMLFCRECYKKFSKQAEAEVDRAFAEDFDDKDKESEIESIKKRLLRLEKEVKLLSKR